jgi:hypothetical protein
MKYEDIMHMFFPTDEEKKELQMERYWYIIKRTNICFKGVFFLWMIYIEWLII